MYFDFKVMVIGGLECVSGFVFGLGGENYFFRRGNVKVIGRKKRYFNKRL